MPRYHCHNLTKVNALPMSRVAKGVENGYSKSEKVTVENMNVFMKNNRTT